jgi:hypothetical protein
MANAANRVSIQRLGGILYKRFQEMITENFRKPCQFIWISPTNNRSTALPK